jgi:amino acid transporter
VLLRSWRSVTRAARFTLVCAVLLVADFIIGVISFVRCESAGDACSTANEWIDTVTVSIAGLLIVLILVGTGVDVVVWYRSRRLRRM